MDYNADGINDMIAGSFDGTIYLSLGNDSGLTAWERVKDENGDNIRLGVHYDDDYIPSVPMPFAPEDSAYEGCRAERCILIDWEGDGDLDLVMGADTGGIYLRRNIGTRAEPVFAALNEIPRTSDGELFYAGAPHSSFSYNDIDGDGKKDLITGNAQGGTVWFRNVTEESMSEPVYAPAESLIDSGSGRCKLMINAPISTSVDSFDYNGDGKIDLLIGNYTGTVLLYLQR